MNTIYLDATALKSWSDCREQYRQSQILNRTSWPPSPHYHFGISIHSAVESFWKGEPYEKAMDVAYAVTNAYPVALLNPSEVDTWKRLVTATPDLVACYYDSVDYSPENLLWNETEWSIEYDLGAKSNHDSTVDRDLLSGNHQEKTQVILCGRMDRLLTGPRLVDVKTASEIAKGGRPWKKAYKEEKLLDFQFGLYDWYLQQMCKDCGHSKNNHGFTDHAQWQCGICISQCSDQKEFPSMAPIECYLEVLIKPYGTKKARLERIDLPEIVSEGYRKRFKQQLAWKVSEIVHYVENYAQQAPWPMNGGSACSSKYGFCSFFDLCISGEIPSVMKHITERQEHLEIRKKKELTSDH